MGKVSCGHGGLLQSWCELLEPDDKQSNIKQNAVRFELYNTVKRHKICRIV